jgi:hypothetical protein
VELVGAGTLLDRPLAGVLDRQGGRDDEYVAQAAEAVGLEDHPREARVDREPRELAAGAGEARTLARGGGVGDEGTELLEQLYAGPDRSAVRRVDEREPLDLAEPEGGHLQDHAGQ